MKNHQNRILMAGVLMTHAMATIAFADFKAEVEFTMPDASKQRFVYSAPSDPTNRWPAPLDFRNANMYSLSLDGTSYRVPWGATVYKGLGGRQWGWHGDLRNMAPKLAYIGYSSSPSGYGYNYHIPTTPITIPTGTKNLFIKGVVTMEHPINLEHPKAGIVDQLTYPRTDGETGPNPQVGALEQPYTQRHRPKSATYNFLDETALLWFTDTCIEDTTTGNDNGSYGGNTTLLVTMRAPQFEVLNSAGAVIARSPVQPGPSLRTNEATSLAVNTTLPLPTSFSGGSYSFRFTGFTGDFLRISGNGNAFYSSSNHFATSGDIKVSFIDGELTGTITLPQGKLMEGYKGNIPVEFSVKTE
ncbi:MAG: hypothetical protein QM627_05085 [Luteolibacter sp.]